MLSNHQPARQPTDADGSWRGVQQALSGASSWRSAMGAEWTRWQRGRGEALAGTRVARVGDAVVGLGWRVSGKRARQAREWNGSETSEGATGSTPADVAAALGKMADVRRARAGDTSGQGPFAGAQSWWSRSLTQADAGCPREVVGHHLAASARRVGGEVPERGSVESTPTSMDSDGILDLGWPVVGLTSSRVSPSRSVIEAVIAVVWRRGPEPGVGFTRRTMSRPGRRRAHSGRGCR